MSTRKRSFRPTPALIVGFIALFVAMGGVGYSAIKLKAGSVKTKAIKNGAVTTPKLAADAVAPDAAKLGGVQPSGYQKFCEPGTIKGSVVLPTAGLAAGLAYQTVAGFNCTGGIVQARRTATAGQFFVKFVGLTSSGSSVCSALEPLTPLNPGDVVDVTCKGASDGGIPAFLVGIRSQAVGLATGDQPFTLVAF